MEWYSFLSLSYAENCWSFDWSDCKWFRVILLFLWFRFFLFFMMWDGSYITMLIKSLRHLSHNPNIPALDDHPPKDPCTNNPICLQSSNPQTLVRLQVFRGDHRENCLGDFYGGEHLSEWAALGFNQTFALCLVTDKSAKRNWRRPIRNSESIPWRLFKSAECTANTTQWHGFKMGAWAYIDGASVVKHIVAGEAPTVTIYMTYLQIKKKLTRSRRAKQAERGGWEGQDKQSNNCMLL